MSSRTLRQRGAEWLPLVPPNFFADIRNQICVVKIHVRWVALTGARYVRLQLTRSCQSSRRGCRNAGFFQIPVHDNPGLCRASKGVPNSIMLAKPFATAQLLNLALCSLVAFLPPRRVYAHFCHRPARGFHR
jgi:hypothetical protein